MFIDMSVREGRRDKKKEKLVLNFRDREYAILGFAFSEATGLFALILGI